MSSIGHGSKIDVAILGTGNIGTDLLIKVLRSKYLNCVMFAGQRANSPGIAYANGLGVRTSTDSIDALASSHAKIVFDATSAQAHKENIKRFNGQFIIDLTPAKIGLMCVPSLNMKEALKTKEVSLISCGAQVLIPRIVKLKNLDFVEVVTTIASKSAGIGTRNNIDEYVTTTSAAITKFCGVPAKTILIINPGEPPITMHNTIYAKIKGKKNIRVIQFKVEGCGDYLPKFSGNLDTINVQAIKIAEEYAKKN